MEGWRRRRGLTIALSAVRTRWPVLPVGGWGVVVQAVVVVRWKVVNTGRSNGRGRRQAGQAERASSSSSSKSASQCVQQASKQAHSKAKRLRLTEAGAAAAPVLIAAEL